MQRVILSPKVRAMLALRMDAAHGTPTIWEKLGAIFGLDGSNNASVLAGDERDLTVAETEVLSLLQPLLHSAEGDAINDLQAFLKTVLGGATSVTSLSQAEALVKSALETAATDLKGQVASLGNTSLMTLISAVLAGLGHLNLPI